jgi:phospholipid transport system substrate-binding protein
MRDRLFQLRVLVFLLLVTVTPVSALAATSDASRFIDDRARTVLAMFNDRALSPEQREARLSDLVTKSFDVPTIARFVLGRHWATATPAERDEFIRVFEHYMVHIYASRFSQYPDAKVKMTGEREEGGDRVLVRSQIQRRGSQESAKVDWWVKKSQDGYKILDVNIEGVSQLVTLRDEFSAVIQQHDGKVAGLIDHLKEKTKG